MDSDGPSTAPASQVDYGAMWRNYNAWVQGIEQERDTALRKLEVDFKAGRGISPEGYTASRSRIEREAGEELGALQRGPTFRMLNEHFQAMTTPRRFWAHGYDTDVGRVEGRWLTMPARSSARTLEQFYGDLSATNLVESPGGDASEAATRAPSPRRGIGTSFEGTSLLDRDESSLFFV